MTSKSSALGKFGFGNPLTRFLLRFFILSSLWFLLYNLILKPGRIIDRPLTGFIAVSSAKLIGVLSNSSETQSPVLCVDLENNMGIKLVRDGKKLIGIWDTCNGIDLMFIFSAVLLLLPGNLKGKVIFLVGGNVFLVFLNILRIVALYFILRYQPQAFNVSHHYVFTFILYFFIFGGWVLFIKKHIHEKAA